ncbi:MAG: hypothetical protein GF416_06020 [Candidatus Altiarchaeales archaeon]|nr:hypothetical protein [Candidatus Altiarchaeales archaeon]MBD3416672.1 hypothetical protein [Candidatus Altiarchaeales archaeon]
MDASKELEEERIRRIKLEEELSAWHQSAIDRLTPEQLAMTVQAQQMESLTFHLLKCRQQITELQKKLSEKERKIESAEAKAKALERKLKKRERDFREFKEESASLEGGLGGQRFGVGGLPSDDELDSLLESTISESHPPKRDKPRNNVKDFIQLIQRMGRIKLYDASLLLDVSQETIVKWAEGLEKKGYVRVEGAREKTLVASDKLLKKR